MKKRVLKTKDKCFDKMKTKGEYYRLASGYFKKEDGSFASWKFITGVFRSKQTAIKKYNEIKREGLTPYVLRKVDGKYIESVKGFI